MSLPLTAPRRTLAPPLDPVEYARLYALRKDASTQTSSTIRWLRRRAVALVGGRRNASVLSIGTGEGDVDLALYSALRESGLSVRYTAVEPSAAQRALLHANLDRHGVSADFEIRPECFEDLRIDQTWDLVLICQSAYYFDSHRLGALLRAAQACVSPGGSLVIVHQSHLGIPEIQAEHMVALKGNREAMLSGRDIAAILVQDRALQFTPARDHHTISATLDVRDCLDPGSAAGVGIMSFCLECDLSRLRAADLMPLRESLSRLADRHQRGRGLLHEPVDVFWLRPLRLSQ